MFPLDIPILVVDDSVNMRNIICENLRNIGYHKITACEEAQSALKHMETALFEAKPIGLIICDLNMPGLSGLELLKKLRGDEAFRGLPFLLITTESEKNVVIEAAMNGVSSYIVKPFTSEILQSRMGDAWLKHRKSDKS